jgi:hypothetical protein
MSETMINTVVAGLIVAGVAWIGAYVLSSCRAILKDNMFDICFTEGQGETEIDRMSFHSIPCGRSEHWVKIVTSIGLDLTDCNIRFFSVDGLTKQPPENLSSTIQILTANVSPEIILQGVKSIQTKDRSGGIDIKFSPAYVWGKGKALFLRIDVVANATWTGKISFQGYDNEKHPRYARADVRVIDTATTPYIPAFPSTSTEQITLREAATIAYERLREFGSIYAAAADKLGGLDKPAAEGALMWFVYFLQPRIPVYGKHPPSRTLELINTLEFKRGGFENGGNSFHCFGEKEPKFTDLTVNRTDVLNLIESIRFDKLDGEEKRRTELP